MGGIYSILYVCFSVIPLVYFINIGEFSRYFVILCKILSFFYALLTPYFASFLNLVDNKR